MSNIFMEAILYIYTWNLFVLYNRWLNPSKQGLFQSKQGSFGLEVYIVIIIFGLLGSYLLFQLSMKMAI